MRWFLLPLVFAFAACDPGTATGPSSSAPPTAQASLTVEADGPYAIAETILLHTEGEHLILEVNGEAVTLTAGQAYLAGQALSRGGYELLDPELAASIKPGDRCEPPPAGSWVVAFKGQLYGGGKCPPPPPPMFFERDLHSQFLDGADVELMEVPEEAEWVDVAGGFMAPDPRY